MNYEQFTWWLHGFLEIANPREINETQTQIIKDHLNLVFNKVTPDRRESLLKYTVTGKNEYTPLPCGYEPPTVTKGVFQYCGVDPAKGQNETVTYCAETFRNESGELVPHHVVYTGPGPSGEGVIYATYPQYTGKRLLRPFRDYGPDDILNFHGICGANNPSGEKVKNRPIYPAENLYLSVDPPRTC